MIQMKFVTMLHLKPYLLTQAAYSEANLDQKYSYNQESYLSKFCLNQSASASKSSFIRVLSPWLHFEGSLKIQLGTKRP